MIQTWNERAHEALKGKVGRLIIWSFACSILLELGLMVDPTYYGLKIDALNWRVISLLGVLFCLVIYPVTIGYYWVILETVRGKSNRFKDVFIPFRVRYGKHLLAAILITLFQVLWTLLLVIPGIIKYFSYAFTYFILRDEPELPATEAISKSQRLMNGRKWDAFKLILPFVPIYNRLDVLHAARLSHSRVMDLSNCNSTHPSVVSRFAVLYEDALSEANMQEKQAV